ncbi:L-histidine N(alpha)-methyltransferase [Henriciella barbarensis]|uniref:L-histidine N(Alpha)-methyltransferase n=1 Tax=Henriciella barbarensis TaxID=86342 RepID=A0A399R5Z1_9PROT|nr:L-histidine N(alpha)-methyltransferase [Henriciella barbarensis]RIJ25981.1 L-histidine N(alpha)-methyltransferase [Henriciella barbarensis]
MDGAGIDPFLQDVLTGLARDQKSIPSRWLYDARGSRLFDDITELDEYYPTRTELTILNEQAAAMADAIGPEAVIVEYGAGSLLKVRILLDALERPKAFVPVDISSEHLKEAAHELKSAYGELEVYPVAADFMDTNLGSNLPGGGGRRAGFFPGSTMGNLLDRDIDSFLRTTREDLGEGACFIIGLDQPKSPDILVPAYDDAKGVTAEFNLNLLRRINRELDGNFDLESFKHEARWNDAVSRIEMHLRSLKAQTVEVAGQTFKFEKGETIHTENSRKIALDRFAEMAESAGWELTRKWTDENGLFAVVLLEAR